MLAAARLATDDRARFFQDADPAPPRRRLHPSSPGPSMSKARRRTAFGPTTSTTRLPSSLRCRAGAWPSMSSPPMSTSGSPTCSMQIPLRSSTTASGALAIRHVASRLSALRMDDRHSPSGVATNEGRARHDDRCTGIRPALEAEYEDFVRRSPAVLISYSLRYRDFLAELLGAEPRYAVALREGRVVGGLPLLTLDGPFGRVLNSLPYFGRMGDP